MDVLAWFCYWTVISYHVSSYHMIQICYHSQSQERQSICIVISYSLVVPVKYWGMEESVVLGYSHWSSWMLDASHWRLDVGCHPPVPILSFQKTSSFACEMNNWVRATLSLVISVIQGWMLCASHELRIRYSLLFLLEMVQVNELKPVEVAENLRHQQRGFQTPIFPMVGTRPGAGQMLWQSTKGNDRVTQRPRKTKHRGESLWVTVVQKQQRNTGEDLYLCFETLHLPYAFEE